MWIFIGGMVLGGCLGVLLMAFLFWAGKNESDYLDEVERWAKIQKEMEGK